MISCGGGNILVLPVVKITIFTFDEYPGCIPVVGCSIGTPTVFPTDAEGNSACTAVVTYAGDFNIVCKNPCAYKKQCKYCNNFFH